MPQIMRTIILTLAIVFSGMLMQAQIYSLSKGVITNINDYGNEYLEVTGYFNVLGTKLKYFQIDYGHEDIGTAPDKITDSNGHEIKFKSTGAMLNYFDKNGWSLIHAYSFGNANQAAMRYIFKRKIN